MVIVFLQVCNPENYPIPLLDICLSLEQDMDFSRHIVDGHYNSAVYETVALFRVYSVNLLNSKCNDQGCYHGILDLFFPR